MKKRFLSMFLTLVMVIGLLPTTAFAAAPDIIYVGGTAMADGQYLDESGNVGTAALTDNYAYYKDGDLTLKNYDYSGDGHAYATDGSGVVTYSALIYADGDIDVILLGDSTLADVDTPNVSVSAIYSNGTIVFLGGTGSLTATVNGDGIITDDTLAVFYATLTLNAGGYGIMANNSASNNDYVSFTNSTATINAVNGAIFTNGNVDIINNSSVTLKSTGSGDGIRTTTGYVAISGNSTVKIDAAGYGIYSNCGDEHKYIQLKDSAVDITAVKDGIRTPVDIHITNVTGKIVSTTDTSEDDLDYCALNGEQVNLNSNMIVTASLKPNGSDPEKYSASYNGLYDWITFAEAPPAAVENYIYLAGVKLEVGKYLQEDGTLTDVKPDDDYAYLTSDTSGEVVQYSLTLHNFDFTGLGSWGKDAYNALYYHSYGDHLEIILEGTNNLKEPDSSFEDTCGIFIGRVNKGPKLLIRGTGTLNIEADTGIFAYNNAQFEIESGNVSIAAEGNGILMDGAGTVSGGTVNINAGETGVYFEDDVSLTVSDGTLNISGGTNGVYSGLYGAGFRIDGGNVTVKSLNTANDDNYYAVKMSYFEYNSTFGFDSSLPAQASTEPDGSNPETYNRDKNSTYDWIKIGSAPAPTMYPVWVAGTQVTSENASNVLSDGAASYDAATNTLTVNKNITATGDNVSAIKATTEDDFTIDIDGSVAISSEDGDGIEVQNKAIVTGGSLTITADSYGIYADEITVDGGTYIVSGWRGLLGKSGVAISNATVTITAKNNAIYSYNDKCYISISKSTVTATSTENRSIFIEEDGEEAITISDSTVTVTGDNCAVYAPKVEVTGNSVVEMKATTTSTPDNDYCALSGCGDNFIVAETLEVLASTEVDGSNPVPYVKADRVNYDWVKIAAPAPTLYDVWVIGKQVTSANASDVLGDGAASYDPATNTLTVKKDISSTTENAIQAETEADFTIDVEGKVKMDTVNGIKYTGDGMMTVIGDELIMDVSGNAVYSDNDLKIECEKLDIDSGTNGIYSGSGDVVINNTQINISYAGYVGILTPYGDVTVNNKVLNITGAKEAILVSEKGKNGKASLTSEEIILSTGQNSIEVIGGNCEIKCKKLKITSKWNGTHIVGNLNISADEIIVVANSDGLRTTKEYNLTIDCDVMDIQSTRTDEDADFYALSCKGTITLPEDVTVIAATEPNGTFEAYDVSKNKTYDHVKIGVVEEVTPITNVEIDGVSAPQLNQTREAFWNKYNTELTDGTITLNEKTYVGGKFDNIIVVDGEFYHADKETVVDNSHVIAPGTYYNALALFPAEGFEFAEDITATVDGATATETEFLENGVLVIYAKYVLEAPAPTMYPVWVGGVGMADGDYLDEAGNVGTTALTDNYAYYNDGVLTLHNFDFTGGGYEYDTTYHDFALVYSPNALKVVLEGVNNLTEDYDKSCEGICSDGAVTITGAGEIVIKVDQDGIQTGTYDAPADVIIEGTTVTIEAGINGIMSSGDAKITDSELVIKANISSGISIYNGSLTIEDCTIDITSIYYEGIYVKEDLAVKESMIEIDAYQDGIASGINDDTKDDGGNVVLEDVTATIKAGNDGIVSDGDVVLTDVIADITSGKDGLQSGLADDPADVVLSGVEITIDAGLNGVLATKEFKISNNSKFKVTADNFGVTAAAFTAAGSEIEIAGFYDGISAKGDVTIESGEMLVKATGTENEDSHWAIKTSEGAIVIADDLSVQASTEPDGSDPVIYVAADNSKYDWVKIAPKTAPAPAEYTITFDANGGSVSPATAETEDGKLASMPTPVRSGSYSFDGWYTAASGGTKVTTDTVFENDTTIYAHWTYTGGSSGGSSDDDTSSSSGNTVVDKPTDSTFEDVAEDTYYNDAVEWAVENDITTGTTDTTFSPDMICTRAQAVTFMWRAAGSPEPVNKEMIFTDVPENAYYYDAVLWAVEMGITTGTNDGTTFSPDMNCSRGQIVTMLWRANGEAAANAVNKFVDVAEGAYYYDAVLWAVANGITNGTSETTFSPDVDCTRAQIVTFMYRCTDNK